MVCCALSVWWTALCCVPDFASKLIAIVAAVVVVAVLAGAALFWSLVFRFTLFNVSPIRVFIGFFIAVLNLVHAVFMRNESHACVAVVVGRFGAGFVILYHSYYFEHVFY